MILPPRWRAPVNDRAGLDWLERMYLRIVTAFGCRGGRCLSYVFECERGGMRAAKPVL